MFHSRVASPPPDCVKGLGGGAEGTPMDREDGLRRHRELEAEGWIRRFTAEDPRLTEMKDLYESMGLEVRVEAGIPEEDAQCQGCFDVEGFSDQYKTIYTRGESSEDGAEGDDLFE
jgi:hypothetical protein